MRFELTCTLDAPREEVFAFLAQADRQTRERWSLVPGVEPPRSPPSDDDDQTSVWLPFGGPREVEYLLHEPPEQLIYRWARASMEGHVEYLLLPYRRGTRLHQSISLEVSSMSQPFRWAARRALHGAAERRLARIQRCLGRLALAKCVPETIDATRLSEDVAG